MGRKRKKPVTTERLTSNLVIRITEREKEQLKQRAAEKGFQNTTKYCRMILRNYESMVRSDLNRELQKIKFQISNLESTLSQIDKNIAYSTYPSETEKRFRDCIERMEKMSKEVEKLLSAANRNGE